MNIFVLAVIGFVVVWWVVQLVTAAATGKPPDDPFSMARKDRDKKQP